MGYFSELAAELEESAQRLDKAWTAYCKASDDRYKALQTLISKFEEGLENA